MVYGRCHPRGRSTVMPAERVAGEPVPRATGRYLTLYLTLGPGYRADAQFRDDNSLAEGAALAGGEVEMEVVAVGLVGVGAQHRAEGAARALVQPAQEDHLGRDLGRVDLGRGGNGALGIGYLLGLGHLRIEPSTQLL